MQYSVHKNTIKKCIYFIYLVGLVCMNVFVLEVMSAGYSLPVCHLQFKW